MGKKTSFSERKLMIHSVDICIYYLVFVYALKSEIRVSDRWCVLEKVDVHCTTSKYIVVIVKIVMINLIN